MLVRLFLSGLLVHNYDQAQLLHGAYVTLVDKVEKKNSVRNLGSYSSTMNMTTRIHLFLKWNLGSSVSTFSWFLLFLSLIIFLGYSMEVRETSSIYFQQNTKIIQG